MRAVAQFDLDSFDEDPPYHEEGGIRHMRTRSRKRHTFTLEYELT